MAFQKVSDKIDTLSNDVKTYIDSTVEYYKLFIFKKGVKSVINVTNMVIIGVIFLIFLAFLSIAAAIMIGEAMDNESAGFFIVAAFYFVVLIIFMAVGKPFIQKMILEKTSKSFFKMNDELNSVKKKEQQLNHIEQSTESQHEVL